jgi:uroporphyrin-III C-methyltransferase
VNGKVYLVGAGPGDPELLTLKALNLLRRADAVLHDDLVSPQILSLAPKTALRYDVGKRRGQKSTRQEAIHFLMIELARQGLNVVRLKGGDPMIFGRAGEEICALREAGIEFDVVPGVTSALAAAAAAEISLTMRDTASSLLIMTGHFADTNHRPLPDLRALLASGTTIALYMPGNDGHEIVNKLAAAGVARHTPCALVARASTSAQQITITTLKELAQQRMQTKPAILIIGDVARLSQHDKLRVDNAFSVLVEGRASAPVGPGGGTRLSTDFSQPPPAIACANEDSPHDRNGAVNHA